MQKQKETLIAAPIFYKNKFNGIVNLCKLT